MSKMTQAEQQLIDNFAMLGEWVERYKYIIELGARLPEFPEQWKVDQYQVKGCLSQVWIRSEYDGERLQFHAVSDSAIVSGLIAILKMIYNNRTPTEILNTPPTFVQKLGLDSHLSPTRSNGLHAMLPVSYTHLTLPTTSRV